MHAWERCVYAMHACLVLSEHVNDAQLAEQNKQDADSSKRIDLCLQIDRELFSECSYVNS